jgi:anthranilate/para-aminobenzoate synthase component I
MEKELKPMNTLELACRYFAAARVTGDGRYLFHLPRQGKSYLGLGCHRIIRYRRDGFHVQTGSGVEHYPAVDTPLAATAAFLDDQYPSFWMVSPDLCRPVSDPELPLLYCVQPRFEIALEDFAAMQDSGLQLPNALTEGWDTEPDEHFLARLEQAVTILQDYPAGKMIITRPYRKIVGQRDPLDLFQRFARSEPMAACSHFLQMDARTCSLGCSPENVFELDRGRLVFDVVAATRGVSPDPAIDARWREALQTDPKEQREHLMALERYRSRIEGLVEPGSLVEEQRLQVLQLGNVRHLYSRLSGRLKNEWNWMRLLADSFPALTSYPEALQPLADNGSEPLRYYGGVLGRVAAGQQQAAFFLNLRAALIKDNVLHTQGGVGVIAESLPAKELLEVRNKLSGLMKAVSAWESERGFDAR